MAEVQTSTDDGGRRKASEPAGAVSKLSLSDLYIQAYTNMRATDEISLKLLAAIPFVSGVGISLLVRKPTDAFPAGARLLVSLFATVVTFAIYRWECRNISNCRGYRDYAVQLERYSLDALPQNAKASLQKNDVPNSGSPGYWFLSWGWVKWLLSRRWGKTEAERLLYWTVIVGWLATGVYVFSYDVSAQSHRVKYKMSPITRVHELGHGEDARICADQESDRHVIVHLALGILATYPVEP